MNGTESLTAVRAPRMEIPVIYNDHMRTARRLVNKKCLALYFTEVSRRHNASPLNPRDRAALDLGWHIVLRYTILLLASTVLVQCESCQILIH